MQATRLYTLLLVSFFFSTTASAQVFDSGPSDPALFTNVLNVPGDFSPGSIGETTQLNVADGGAVRDFFDVEAGGELNISGGLVGIFLQSVAGSEVNISGGEVSNLFGALGGVVNISGGFVGEELQAFDSVVNISGGEVADAFLAGGGSVVNISGGEVGLFFDAEADSEVNISGGFVNDFFNARPGSVVNISGGEVGNDFLALDTSVVNISGGTVGNAFLAGTGSNINLFGSDFILDGVSLDDLVADEAFTITDRDVTLSGLLADGTAFSFDLSSARVGGQDQFLADANLTVTLSTEFLLGDVNRDSVVNFLDISPFISVLSINGDQAEADINEDGVVDFLDIAPFILLLSS